MSDWGGQEEAAVVSWNLRAASPKLLGGDHGGC